VKPINTLYGQSAELVNDKLDSTGGPFPEGKARPGHDVDHSPRSSAEVKNE
jgi:hypothetical protein